ncbi:MAG TPA: hypothetical protein VF169_10835 [Albitalea sp.]|uniref:hypothetical protein n=1 Tax=Piscinibacter sp. TaxID=1903157 RepID=UPI002ED1E029
MYVFGFSTGEGLSLDFEWNKFDFVDPDDGSWRGEHGLRNDSPSCEHRPAPYPGATHRQTHLADILPIGEPFDTKTANELIRQGRGRLTWAKDGADNWWIVAPQHKDCVENAECGYRGPGLKFGPADGSCQSNSPVDSSELEYIRNAWTPLADNGHDGRVHLEPGHAYTTPLAQRLVEQSRGALRWAEDGNGDWWVVPQRDMDKVEQARRAGEPYAGRGVRVLDSSLHGYTITPGDAQVFNEAASTLVGDTPHAMIRIRPGTDGWNVDLAQRVADMSGGKLCVVTDAQQNQYLIARRDKNWFDLHMRRPDQCIHVGERRRRHDMWVQQEDLDWIGQIVD